MELELNLDLKDTLASIVHTPGYKVVDRIMKAMTDKYITKMINSDAEDENQVLANHKLAKVAARFYTMVTEQINEEMIIYARIQRI